MEMERQFLQRLKPVGFLAEKDHDFYTEISLEEAEENLRIAREVCEEIEDYLKLVLKE